MKVKDITPYERRPRAVAAPVLLYVYLRLCGMVAPFVDLTVWLWQARYQLILWTFALLGIVALVKGGRL